MYHVAARGAAPGTFAATRRTTLADMDRGVRDRGSVTSGTGNRRAGGVHYSGREAARGICDGCAGGCSTRDGRPTCKGCAGSTGRATTRSAGTTGCRAAATASTRSTSATTGSAYTCGTRSACTSGTRSASACAARCTTGCTSASGCTTGRTGSGNRTGRGRGRDDDRRGACTGERCRDALQRLTHIGRGRRQLLHHADTGHSARTRLQRRLRLSDRTQQKRRSAQCRRSNHADGQPI
jgi:hypothetical protein